MDGISEKPDVVPKPEKPAPPPDVVDDDVKAELLIMRAGREG